MVFLHLIIKTVVLTMLITHSVICQNYENSDQRCSSLENPSEVCLTIENLRQRGFGFLAAFMKGGDPCFLNPKHKYKRVCFVSTALQGGKFFAPCSCNIEACGCTGKPIKSANSNKVNFNSNQSDNSNITVLPKEEQCKSNIPGSKKRCLRKDEVGSLSVRMNGGNPCFAPVKGEGICFVSKDGKMETCSCENKKCGCYYPQNEKKTPTRESNKILRIPTKPTPNKQVKSQGTCKSSNFGSNKRCLRKNEVGNFADFMQAGDPCFLRKGNRWCFVSKSGLMEPCSCRTKECGCKDESDVVPTPKCDGSSIPESIDACETKYCQTRYNTGPFKHTACRYCGIGRLCGSSICQYGLTDNERRSIVKKHNELRSIVAQGLESRGVGGRRQPSAANMKKMSWDDDLAEVAQTWANQCLGEENEFHDKNRRTSKFRFVGQNYASKFHSANLGEKFLESMIQDLYDEVKDFPPENIFPFDTKRGVTGDVGHYTQIAWADTNKVGCGFIMYKKGSWFKKVLVCNYGPGGNMIRGRMYIEGEPGSMCSNGSEEGLCL